MITPPSTPTLPSPSTPRRPLHWTLQLPAAPAAVMTALDALATGEMRVLSRQPLRLVLACGDDDVRFPVAIELRAHGDGTELIAFNERRRVSWDYVKATTMALFVLWMGLAMSVHSPRFLMFGTSVPSLLYLIAAWIGAKRRRQADLTRILHAVDRAIGPLKTRDERPYRALAGGDEPEPRRRRGRRR